MKLEDRIVDIIHKSAKPIDLHEISGEVPEHTELNILRELNKLCKNRKVKIFVKPLNGDSPSQGSTYYYIPRSADD